MYLGVDIGGTKTLVMLFTEAGKVVSSTKFATPSDYTDFLRVLSKAVAKIPSKSVVAAGVALPGEIDRKHGIGIACGNLPWRYVPIDSDITNILHCPVVVENDAKLAGLSEAILLKGRYDRVLYITISTGIGVGLIVDQAIDPGLANSEAGHMMIESNGALRTWEDLASGHAIVRDFGARAEAISDEKTWRTIAHRIALGLINLIAVIEPEVIVVGGGVGAHFEKFREPLMQELRAFETPLVPIPPIIQANRPEEAVAYGCLEIAKEAYAAHH